MPLPVAHGLIGASIVATALPDFKPARDWKLMALGAALSIAPDLDFFLRTPWHRGFTHSLISAALVGAVCFAAAGRAHLRTALGLGAAILSHGLLDFASTKAMPGVELLWPVTERRFGLGVIDYYDVTGLNPVTFMTENVLGDMLRASAIELLIFLPLLLFVLAIKWIIHTRSQGGR